MPPGSFLDQGVQETPIKKGTGITPSYPRMADSGTEKENVKELCAEKDGPAKNIGTSQEDSIYKSLGWDDADDFDELA
jgi:hypothetical protein